MALIGACAASFLIFKPANSDILPPNIDFGNILDFATGSIGELFDSDLTVNDFTCNLPGIKTIGSVRDRCNRAGTGDNIGFDQDDLITTLAGYLLVASKGCADKSYNPAEEDPASRKNVALLGDSLTHFGGIDEFWDAYLGQGRFKVLALGAAGSTSWAWRKHFDYCDSKDNPIQLPPRSIMMIGGNDFHVFKGILIPMWWAVPFRHAQVLNNLERMVTHHVKGNDGKGDPDQNDGVPRGRLFVVLGNIPAISPDPTTVPGLKELYKLIGVWEKPNPIRIDDPNSFVMPAPPDLLGFNLNMLMDAYLAFSYPDISYKVQQILSGQDDTDHSWASRQMYKLQFYEHVMAIKRSGPSPGSVPYVHMYHYFRDKSAVTRGCWWCAERGFWMDETNDPAVTFSFRDGIHINHLNGYALWGAAVTPMMDLLQMQNEKRTDSLGIPGEETDWGGGDCDDLCLLLLCIYAGICK